MAKYDLMDKNLWRESPDDPNMFELIPGVKEEYLKTAEDQLDTWVAGDPQHNHIFDECCPDFSCCQPNTLWPEAQRMAFKNATPEQRQEMLMFGLAGLAAQQGEGIYIAGLMEGVDDASVS